MTPAKFKSLHQCEMFRISSIYACRQEILVVRLIKHIPWESFEYCFGTLYCTDIGRLGLPNRTIAGLLTRYTRNLSQARLVRFFKRRQVVELLTGHMKEYG